MVAYRILVGVSIPFSSGRRRRRRIPSPAGARYPGLNPLLIGEAAPPESSGLWNINLIFVSIPFSSGRRRRPADSTARASVSTSTSQSPSHRGGGAAAVDSKQALMFFFERSQSPSHRGGGAAPIKVPHVADTKRGLNPLLIGEAAPP